MVPAKGWNVVWLKLMAVLFLTAPLNAQLSESVEIAFAEIDDHTPYENWLLPFVCIQDVKQLNLISGVKSNFSHGFLKGETEKQFEVIGLDLRHRTFDKSTQKFVSIDFAEYSKEIIANKRPQIVRGDIKVERWVQLLVLARAAYQRGDFDSCDNFLTGAASQNRRANFGVECRAALARADLLDVLLLFGDMKVTRPEILSRLQKYLNTYPEMRFPQLSIALEDDLIEMVAQDAKHETPVNISSLTVDQQIDEWIFQLRNQNAIQSIAPGIWDIFWADAAPTPDGSAMDTSTPHRTSPAMQLVKLGNAAVPKLIECIGDSKPTRSTIFHRDLYFSDQLLTVGACAEIILSRIAGQRFGDGQTKNVARQEAEAWWREVSTKGEEQYLIERVAKGGKVSVEAARALAAKFPDTAFDCIANAIDGSNDTGVQSELLDVIGQLPRTEKSTTYFKHQLKNARDLKTRVTAARAIMDQDRDNAIMTMIREFQQMTTTDLGGHWESEELALISFLSQSNSAIAIQEIRKAYDSRKPPIRTAIIQLSSDNCFSPAGDNYKSPATRKR